jgi:glycerophosphoryl diester phosphodiesterase
MFVKYQLIAHRGASAYAPENTLASFKKAHEFGARFVEFDVMLSVDGEPFVFHDDKVDRTTNGQGEVGRLTSDELRVLDAGFWFSKDYEGEKIPTLQEKLAWLDAHNVQANIEIKPFPGTVEATTTAVLSHVNRYWPQDKALPLVSSFNVEALKQCRDFSPEMPLGLLLSHWREDAIELAHELKCYSVHINAQDAKKSRISELKKAGFAVCVYTVNRKRQAMKLFNWGVDAVFSDYPDLLSGD